MSTRYSTKFIHCILFTLLVSVQAYAKQPVGVISKSNPNFASDLKGQDGLVLSASQIKTLKQSGTDLSTIDPVDSDVWTVKGGHTLQDSDVDLQDGDTVKYAEKGLSLNPEFWFSAYSPTKSSVHYDILIGRKAHNFLLRAELLKKIGYVVPDVKSIATLTIQFDGPVTKSSFVEDLKTFTGNPDDYAKRWFKNEDGTSITLQDVVVMKSNVDFYNLSEGVFSNRQILGQRALNALTIAFAMTEVPESVNLLSWVCGTLHGNEVDIMHPFAEQFNPTFDDARWIVKRIASLKDSDYDDIIKVARFPREVGELLKLKLMGRRDTLVSTFEVTSDPFNPKLDFTDPTSPLLKKGKLYAPKTKDKKMAGFWPGWGSKFSFGDFDDPFSFSEIAAYAESIVLGGGIDNAVSLFNKYVAPNDDVNGELQNRLNAAIVTAFKNYIETGVWQEVHLGTQTVNHVMSNAVVSRELVMGSYLGTDSNLQLADSIGVAAGDGLAIQAFDALPTAFSLNADLSGQVSRVYTKVEPVVSIKASMKKPFKNFLVPLFENKVGRKMGKAEASGDILKAFTDQFQVGESLIITDSLSLKEAAALGYGFNSQLGFSLHGILNQLVISRVHIYRASATEIQVYKENGDLGQVDLGFGLNAANVPVLQFDFPFGKGYAHTKLYRIDTSDNTPKATQVKALHALGKLLKYGISGNLDNAVEPYDFRYNFTFHEIDLNVFFFKWKHRAEFQKIIARDDKLGEAKHVKEYDYHLKETLSGVDYQSFGLSGINAIFAAFIKDSFISPNLSLPVAPDPANSIKGHSKVTKFEFEGEKHGQYLLAADTLADFIVRITHSWKGFSATRDAVDSVMREIQKETGYQLYPAGALNTTKKVRFYDVDLYTQINVSGVDKLMSIGNDEILNLMLIPYFDAKVAERDPVTQKVRLSGPKEIQDGNKRKIDFNLAALNRLRKSYADGRAVSDVKKVSQSAVDFVDILNSTIQVKGINYLLKGEGIVITSQVGGLRYGDENGDENNVSSNLVGHADGKYPNGPFEMLMKASGTTTPELLLKWLLNGF